MHNRRSGERGRTVREGLAPSRTLSINGNRDARYEVGVYFNVAFTGMNHVSCPRLRTALCLLLSSPHFHSDQDFCVSWDFKLHPEPEPQGGYGHRH